MVHQVISPALNNKSGYGTVKNRVVVGSAAHVTQEVGNGSGRHVRRQYYIDVSQVGFETHSGRGGTGLSESGDGGNTADQEAFGEVIGGSQDYDSMGVVATWKARC